MKNYADNLIANARLIIGSVQNPEEPAEIKTGFDEGESEKADNQEQ